MCIVSNVGDGWIHKRFPDRKPERPVDWSELFGKKGPTREEFDELKKDVEALLELLIKAKEIDTALGTPDCEMDEKVGLIKALAKLVGVDMSAVFK